jgi:hypothetical protein
MHDMYVSFTNKYGVFSGQRGREESFFDMGLSDLTGAACGSSCLNPCSQMKHATDE